jgi:arylsulfatase A-like enzyme
VMFDSLNRHMLSPYGCDWTHTPNFARLAERAVTFDRSYVGSMPCMPARRELHTARPNFLHRAWGPLEPFDDSVPMMLQKAGVYTHLVSDHYHYWEDGGCTYHTHYNTWEFFRGQEGDPWIGQVADPTVPEDALPDSKASLWRQDWVNRRFTTDESRHPQTRTFDAGLNFIERNRDADRWMLQIECFDPHEPFFAHVKYKELYAHEYSGPHFDWPAYRAVNETPRQVDHVRREYAALLSMCDASLGRVLDTMDRHKMWDDTMLIVWTDHGFMLGERNFWAKVWMGWYEETSHTPLFLWDPRCKKRNERRTALVQPALDIGPTILEFFDVVRTPQMLGLPLRGTIENDAPIRDAALFGHFGAAVNVTDGRYVYFRKQVYADIRPFHYTLFPTVMRGFLPLDVLRTGKMSKPLPFTKEIPVVRFGHEWPAKLTPLADMTHELYDLQDDPHQEHPITDGTIEQIMIDHLTRLMRRCDAPPEQFIRLGLH